MRTYTLTYQIVLNIISTISFTLFAVSKHSIFTVYQMISIEFYAYMIFIIRWNE